MGALLTMAGVVGIGVLEGIAIGVLFSLIFVLQALTFPNDAVLGQVGPEDFRDVKRHSEAKVVHGMVLYRFMGLLFFANCTVFRDRAEELVQASPVPLHGFILDASAIFEVDLAACEVLADFHSELRDRGIRLVIANLRDEVRDRLVRGWEDAACEKGLFATSLRAAVRDLQTRHLDVTAERTNA